MQGREKLDVLIQYENGIRNTIRLIEFAEGEGWDMNDLKLMVIPFLRHISSSSLKEMNNSLVEHLKSIQNNEEFLGLLSNL